MTVAPGDVEALDLGQLVFKLRARSQHSYVLIRDHYDKRRGAWEFKVSILKDAKHLTSRSTVSLVDACARLLGRE